MTRFSLFQSLISNLFTLKGWLYMILLVSANFLKTICNSQYFYIMMIIGLRLRSAMSLAIFKKSLRLSAKSRKERTGQTKMARKEKILDFEKRLVLQSVKRSI